MSVAVAFRAFFKTMFNREVSTRVADALAGKPALPAPTAEKTSDSKVPSAKPQATKPKQPSRSEALALLELLQREARLIDFLMEPIETYSDEQIGAAVRDVHRGSHDVIERVFGIEPLSEVEEGETLEVPSGYSPHAYRLVGNVVGKAPFKGELMHHGWKASKTELPTWTGTEPDKLVISPCEVEVK